MRRPTRLLIALLLLLLGWLTLPVPFAVASSGISAQVRQVYEQDQTIPPCRFTSQQLTTAQNAVDAYDLEYFADYIAAIQNALTLRAAGACSKNAATLGHAQAGPVPPAPSLPNALTAPTRSGFPLPMLLMALFALALAGVATAIAVGRNSSAAWAGRWRHGTAEARYRAAGVWDRITERVRR